MSDDWISSEKLRIWLPQTLENALKSGENLYDVSQVRVEHEHSELEQNPYAPPMIMETHETPANTELHGEFGRASTRIRVIPMLSLVALGILLGHYFISSTIFPPSRHVLQHFRGAAIGALLGVLLYAMMEYFFPRED